ncbi:MAG: GNAT family N-acetyltransferase [Gammaproteobacteria bacterium]
MATTFRTTLGPPDPLAIEQLVRATGFFNDEEIGIARELADDGLAHGAGGHYRFVLADSGRDLAGYACFGPVPCTQSAWDLYWIAVDPRHQGQHLGRDVLARVESAVRNAGGTRIYADTSSRRQYAPTRAFYERRGYEQVAELPEFYAPGDGKIVFGRVLT